ncbi:hypothetical protein ACOMHN_035232 [Nucella lapillus]
MNQPLLPVAKDQRFTRVFPEVPTLLYFMALVTQIPVQQFWLYDHFSKQYGFNATKHDDCVNLSADAKYTDLENKVQSATTEYIMYIGFVCNFTAVLPTLILGPMTDRFGRKFVFYLSLLVLLVSEALVLCIFYFNWSPNMLLVSGVIVGLSGNFGLYLTAAFSMVADITSEQRSFRLTTLDLSIAVGFSLGLALSGMLVEDLGYIWPMAISLGLVALAILYFFFLIPETYTDRPQHVSFCGSISKSYQLFVKDEPAGQRPKLLLSLLAFLIFCSAGGEGNFITLYLLHQPFCWQKMSITVYGGAYTVTKWIVILVVVSLLKRRVSEPVLGLLGTVSATACYLLKGLAKTDLLFIVGTVTGLVTDIVSPMTRTVMSHEVSKDDQGALFAGIGVLQMIVSAASGVGLTYVYNVGLGFFLGLPYMVLTGLSVITAFILMFMKRYPSRQQEAAVAPLPGQDPVIN